MRRERTIDFYLDFTSPYAYLASTQIESLAERCDCSVVWRPFLIGATFKVTGRKAPVQHPLVRDYMYQDVQRFARLLNQPLNFPQKFPILSVRAGRLFYFLEEREGDQELAKAFAGDVYRAYFVDSQDISSSQVLAEIVSAYRLDAGEVDEIITSPAMKDRFRNEVEQAIERKIFGAPIFVVDDQMFWGVDRMEQLEHWLNTGGW